MTDQIIKLQERVLKLLANKVNDFYLTGGTALSRYYFQHRLSEDLDFFTQEYNRVRITEIIGNLSQELKREIQLKTEETGQNKRVKMAIFYFTFGKSGLKIDFVEDYLRLLHPCRIIDGIAVHSLPDIYLRKIYTVISTSANSDLIGRNVPVGRQEAKDFFDLYFLSHTSERLSNFAWKHCSAVERENLIRWYRTYDRMHIKTGLLDLRLGVKKKLDYREMDAHFNQEIDHLLGKEIGKL